MREKKDIVAYSVQYNKANTKMYGLRFNYKTDADIINYLDNLENKQGFIRQLIRQAIAQQEKTSQ